MSFCAFGENYALFDVTPVENMFLQEYMLRAPGDYVKVYLYGLMQCYHPAEAMSLARMARDMDLPEEEVFHAFQYWERAGLVRRVADSPARYVYKNLKHKLAMSAGGAESLYQYKDFNAMLHSIFDKRRKLDPQDYDRLYEWIERLDLPEAAVIMLIQHCIDLYGVRFSFEKAGALAREWAESGVRTVEDAEEMTRTSRQQADGLKRVLRRLGQRRAPSMDEEELYRKWTKDWGFEPAAILEACKETTKGAPTMAYLGGILQRQHKLGLHRAGEIAGQKEKEAARAEPVKAIYRALGRRGVAPTQEDLDLVNEWLESGVSPELMELAARAAHRSGGNSLEGVRRLLSAWQAKGLRSTEAVDTYLRAVRRDDDLLAEMFDACGERRAPAEADRARLATWRDDWGMPRELLLLAAGRAAGAAVKMSFIDRVLSQWRAQGVATVEAARAESGRHAAARTSGQPAEPSRPVREVAQHRYAQRQYSAEELDALGFDMFDMYKDAREEAEKT